MATNLPEQNESNMRMEKEQPITQEKWGEERSRKARLENLEKARQAKLLKTQNFSIEPLPITPKVQDIVKPLKEEDVVSWYSPLISAIATTLMSGAVSIAVAYIVDSIVSKPVNNPVTSENNEEPDVKGVYYKQSIFK